MSPSLNQESFLHCKYMGAVLSALIFYSETRSCWNISSVYDFYEMKFPRRGKLTDRQNVSKWFICDEI